MIQQLRLVAPALLLLPLTTGCDLLVVRPTESTPLSRDYGRPLPEGEMALEKITDPTQYPDFGDGFRDRETLVTAIDGTLDYFAKPSSKQWFPYLDITHDRSVRSLERFRETLLAATSAEDLNQKIVEEFEVYRSKGWDGSGAVLYTGYCQPIYEASEVETEEFRYPLYTLPAEIVKAEDGTPLGWDRGAGLEASPNREQINNGLLANRDLELYWLKDRLEVYIVHVQGSAKLTLPNGEERSVGYAGKTELPYRGLGQSLVEEGEIDRGGLNLFAVKDFFARNPDKLDHYLNQNQSYVFFTEIVGGPYGSMNIPVTAYRTLATDKKVFPRGGIVFSKTAVPDPSGQMQNFHEFLVDQDTGGAIRSAGRADIFLGTGPEAEGVAGGVHAEGRLYYLYAN